MPCYFLELGVFSILLAYLLMFVICLDSMHAMDIPNLSIMIHKMSILCKLDYVLGFDPTLNP